MDMTSMSSNEDFMAGAVPGCRPIEFQDSRKFRTSSWLTSLPPPLAVPTPRTRLGRAEGAGLDVIVPRLAGRLEGRLAPAKPAVACTLTKLLLTGMLGSGAVIIPPR